MNLDETLRQARTGSEVSDAHVAEVAGRIWRGMEDQRTRRRSFRHRATRRRVAEVTAAAAFVAVALGGFAAYGHGGSLLRSVTGGLRGTLPNTPIQIGKAFVYPDQPGTFSRATLLQMKTWVAQWHVATTPRKYEVYLLTGGLGTPNSQGVGMDNAGNVNLSIQEGTGYQLQEWADSPALWRVTSQSATGYGIAQGNDPSVGHAIGWVKKTTSSGLTYYQWHADTMDTWYYFRKGNTYVSLNVSDPSRRTVFPAAITNYLVPLGNPVKK